MDAKLDPLTTVIRLALIAYRGDHVKVGITQTGIVLFTDTWLDRSRRTLYHWLGNGCSREFLFALRPPLEQAVAWYRHQYPVLFDWAYAGLAKLRTTYTCSNVAETITLAMRTLQDPAVTTLNTLPPAWSDVEIKALISWLTLLHQNPAKLYIADGIELFLEGKAPELKGTEVRIVAPTT